MKINHHDYSSWHDKGVVQFTIGHYADALETWHTAYRYINDPAVPRYYEDIAGLIGEALEQLLPRCTEPALATFISTLSDIYRETNLLNELSVALIQRLWLQLPPEERTILNQTLKLE